MRVTVVIANRDYADTVAASMRSVYAQDYGHVGLLVVDDGSQDDSWDVIRGVGGHAEVFRTSDSVGQARARNIAIEAAWDRTDVFAFLGSGDEYLPGAVSRLVGPFLDDPGSVGIVYCDALGKYREPFAYDRLLAEDAVGGNFLVSRWALEKFGKFDPSFLAAETYDLALRVASRSSAVHVAEPLIKEGLTGWAFRKLVPPQVLGHYEERARSNVKAWS